MRVLEKNMQMLKATGFWIDKNEPRSFVYYMKRGLVHNICFFGIYGIFYGLPMYMYKHSNSFSEVAECLGNGIGAALTVTIYLTLVLKNDELMELVEQLRNVDESYPPTNERTKAIYEKSQKLCRFWSITFLRASFAVFAFLSVVVAIDILRERNIEHRIKFIFPFDVKQPGAFELAAITFSCNFYYASFMNLGFNLMILCMFLNIVCQLRMLNSKMANLRSTAEKEVQDQQEGTEISNVTSTNKTETSVNKCLVDTELNGWQQPANNHKDCHNMTSSTGGDERLYETKTRTIMQDLLKECIAHHCELLKFIRAFNQHWNAFFSMNMINCLAQSVLILTSSAMRDGNSNLLVHFGIVGGFYSMLGIFCYLSQQVTVESELLQESIYGCGWTESSKSFKKLIGIMVSVTNQPIVIKAGGFIPLSLDTFKRVLNSAYSYYMVLSSL